MTWGEPSGIESASVALITGAVGGLGAEIVRGFDAAGYRIVLVDLAAEAMAELARDLNDAFVVAADLRDETESAEDRRGSRRPLWAPRCARQLRRTVSRKADEGGYDEGLGTRR